MEIVLYQSGVGKYYPVVQLGDLTNFQSGYPGGLSQGSGGLSFASKQGTWSNRPADPLKNESILLDNMSGNYYPNPPSTAYGISIYHESIVPATMPWEFRIAALSGGSETMGLNTWGSRDTQSYVWFAVAMLNMIQRFGFYIYNEDAGVWAFVYQPQNSDSLNEIWSEAETGASPGDKGFIPTGAYTNKNKPGIGGKGTDPGATPRYKGDPVTQPGAPDESQASAVGSGFINCYKIDTANLNKVGQCLYGSTLLGLLQSLSINPLDFIISLMVFPTNPDVGAAENIKLGGWLAAAAGGAALGFDATGNRLASQFKVVDFGTLQIPENWGSFLDYESQIELYLPFIGTVSIDVSECMGGSINVQYTIDFFTGMCVANVLCSKPAFVLPNGDVIANVEAQHAYQGNCAIQIPLSAINYGNMVGSLINACTQGITNPVAGMINAGETALSGGFRPSVTSKGNIVANSGFCSVLYPYIRITRPITAEPESFQEVLGYPSYINTTLGECEGLCVCEDIDIEGITGATENELSRIKSLCSEGVYI